MAAKLRDIPIFEGEKHEGLSKSSVLRDATCCYITNILLTSLTRVCLKVGGGNARTRGYLECAELNTKR